MCVCECKCVSMLCTCLIKWTSMSSIIAQNLTPLYTSLLVRVFALHTPIAVVTLSSLLTRLEVILVVTVLRCRHARVICAVS